MNYKMLIELNGEVVQPLEYWPARPKACGRMWEGSAIVRLNGFEFYLNMWHHGGDELTLEQAYENCNLRGIKNLETGKHYDTHWHCVQVGGKVFLHPTGWFKLNEKRIGLEELANEMRKTPNEQVLFDNGFIKVA